MKKWLILKMFSARGYVCGSNSCAKFLNACFFSSFFTRLLDDFETVFLQVPLSVSAYPSLFPEKPFARQSRKIFQETFLKKMANRVFWRNNLKVRQFFLAKLVFLHQKTFLQVQKWSCETFGKCERFVPIFCHHYGFYCRDFSKLCFCYV